MSKVPHPFPQRGQKNEPSRPYGAKHSWNSKPDQYDSEPKAKDEKDGRAYGDDEA